VCADSRTTPGRTALQLRVCEDDDESREAEEETGGTAEGDRAVGGTPARRVRSSGTSVSSDHG
jgi:hypothetical protein